VVAYGALVFTGEPAYANIADGQWITHEENYAVVHRMCVKQGLTGRGYGRRFMTEAERVAAQSKRSMRIDTHADNRTMQHLMRSMGYTYCGIIYFESRYLTAFEKIL
ncbi:MAG: GNAT family N-acetyltransferase, partial [Alistipes sp.]|nr:GNAT family N-acetyltransferase [Alistipes sp.]